MDLKVVVCYGSNPRFLVFSTKHASTFNPIATKFRKTKQYKIMFVQMYDLKIFLHNKMNFLKPNFKSIFWILLTPFVTVLTMNSQFHKTKQRECLINLEIKS